MKPYCYFKGEITPISKVGLSLDDLGVLRGFGVFDFLRVYNGRPFYLSEHLKRFKNSAKLLGLNVPITEKELRAVIWALRKKNKCEDCSVRLVLTGGQSTDGISITGKPTFFILMDDQHELPSKVFKQGGKLITVEHERMLPESKNINYIKAVLSKKRQKKEKAVEVLYIKDNFVSEATTSNFFIVKKGKLITPKEGILKGITRKIVLDLARKNKIKIEERPIKLQEVKSADECFITATNKRVAPIVEVDNLKIGGGVPGPITVKLLEEYNDIIKNY